MQLMTFNSLLMFDIVFVFFLFLVAVTCLVYYLPTGKQHQPASENHQCRHNRHNFYHSHNQRHHHSRQNQHKQHELHHYQKSVKQDQDHQRCYHIECENEDFCEHHQIIDESQQLRIGNKIIPSCHHSCQCNLTDCEHYYNIDDGEDSPAPSQLNSTSGSFDGNTIKLYRSPSSDCCLEDSDDNDSITCGESGRFNALNATFTEHFVVVNETERALPTPHCCYVKAKFADDKDCVGPIADV